jgi:hypothetical protein
MIEQIDLPADPAVDTIPAICDRISRQLAEARTLSEVTALRDKAEALRLYAQRRGAARRSRRRTAAPASSSWPSGRSAPSWPRGRRRARSPSGGDRKMPATPAISSRPPSRN